MRCHLLRLTLAAVLVAPIAGCSSGSGVTSGRSNSADSTEVTTESSDVTTESSEVTTESGGSSSGSTSVSSSGSSSTDCDLTEEDLSTPKIASGGVTVDATLGLGELECGAVNADGYIVFGGDPDIFDAAGTIEIVTAADDSPRVSWDGPGSFVSSDPGHFVLDDPEQGCNRVTIFLESPSGRSTAGYGLDIRVGGDAIPCPQRSDEGS
jgi:hypothetical protein